MFKNKFLLLYFMNKKHGNVKPNVLVAGFPKCGTTWLYYLLRQHPEIYIPDIKEINYFNKDHFFLSDPKILNPRYFKPRKWYYKFFRPGIKKKIKIDFSILSALDLSSVVEIKKELGDIKILFITRNKKDFLNSVRNFLKKEGAKGKHIEDYTEQFSDFEKYINIYKKFFSNIYVTSLEKLNQNSKKELNNIMKFLGIKKFEFKTDTHKHKTKSYKMGWFQYMRRQIYVKLVKCFYYLISLTVMARATPKWNEKLN